MSQIDRTLTGQEVAYFSARGTLRTLAQIAFEWTCILGMSACAISYGHWWLYVIAIPWNGSRMHALGVLNHEGVHQRIHRTRWINDLIADALCAWPVFLSLRSFRTMHLLHHAEPNGERDPDWLRKRGPDWTFPMTVPRLVRMLAGDLLLYRLGTKLREIAPYVLAPERRSGASGLRWLTYLPVTLALVVHDLWVHALLLWILPFVTWTNMTAHIRSISDHFAIHAGAMEERTRTLRLSFLGRFFIMPNGINYHCEHHAYPSVPFFRLPELHEKLTRDPSLRSRMHVTQGVLGLLREIEADRIG